MSRNDSYGGEDFIEDMPDVDPGLMHDAIYKALTGSPFSALTVEYARQVLGDTDTWTGGEWQRAAVHLASAIASIDKRAMPPACAKTTKEEHDVV